MATKPIPKLPRAATVAARLVRSGTIPHVRGGAGDSLRTLATGIARDLDDLAKQTDLSTRERAAESASILASAKRSIKEHEATATRMLEQANTHARQVESAVRVYENSLSPIGVDRVRRRAEQLAKLPERERAARFDAALDAADHEAVLAMTVVEPDSAVPRQGLACLLCPGHYQSHIEAAPAAIGFAASLQVLREGLDHLELVAEPWSAESHATPVEVRDVGLRGYAAAGVDVGKLIPRDWTRLVATCAVPDGGDPKPRATTMVANVGQAGVA